MSAYFFYDVIDKQVSIKFFLYNQNLLFINKCIKSVVSFNFVILRQ